MLRVVINADQKKGIINKNIYGHFSEHLGRCIYEGYWVGYNSPIPNTRGIRNDVIEALRETKIPVLRWPGGCFADNYHWMDGIGSYENRPHIVNAGSGDVVENNHFGTHEFFDLCEMIGAEPYICGNLGSGTVQEMRDWVEYITFDGETPMAVLRRKNGKEKPWSLKYFGIGNENWGCGGRMRPEYYADLYRRYSTYVRNFSGNKIYKIACGPCNNDYNWTDVLMRMASQFIDGLSLHYYTRPKSVPAFPGDRPRRPTAVDFNEEGWFIILKNALYMDELVRRHSSIMDKYDPAKRVGLIIDEWGTWFDPEPGTNPRFLYQQNTLRDALVAGINLNIFNNHCDRVQMSNIAQTINVLQAMILTEGEKMILTPTYHVFNMYKIHQDAELLDVICDGGEYSFMEESIPQLNISASIDINDKIHITLCNTDPGKGLNACCELRGTERTAVKGIILTSDQMNAHNTFDEPDNVKPETFNGVSINNNVLSVSLPPMSVAVVTIE